ncbi:NAD(P)-binding protein [Hypoxylon crocopeplum]|nr:NAD(P)-binding protein [Hypoxylon crocopeplum]
MTLRDTVKSALHKPEKSAGPSNGAEQSDVIISPGSLVVVTGVNGYMGSHIVDQLLQRGYRVRGTVRSASKDQWVKEYFDGKYGANKFELFEVSDMMASGAFDEAVKGASGFIHTATPVMSSPDPHATIPIAVDSTIRSLESAAKEPLMKRVVLTSSSGASASAVPNKVFTIDSNSWNEAAVEAAYAPPPYEGLERVVNVYFASKTKGEQAAWQWMRENNPPFTLNTILPDANFGPPIDLARQEGRSTLAWIKNAFEKSESASPENLPGMVPQHFIDVRDDGALHVAALIYPDVIGERLFAYATPYNWNDISQLLHKLHPERKFAGPIPGMGKDMSKVANERAEELLKRLTGHGWTSLEESIKGTTEVLARQ